MELIFYSWEQQSAVTRLIAVNIISAVQFIRNWNLPFIVGNNKAQLIDG